MPKLFTKATQASSRSVASLPVTESLASDYSSQYRTRINPEDLREKRPGVKDRVAHYFAWFQQSRGRFTEKISPDGSAFGLSRKYWIIFAVVGLVSALGLILGLSIGLTVGSSKKFVPLPNNVSTFRGTMSMFSPDANTPGACGIKLSRADPAVAVSPALFRAAQRPGSSGSMTNSMCGQTLRAVRYNEEAKGMRSIDLTVSDICERCRRNDFQVTEGAFSKLAPMSDNRVTVEWAMISNIDMDMNSGSTPTPTGEGGSTPSAAPTGSSGGRGQGGKGRPDRGRPGKPDAEAAKGALEKGGEKAGEVMEGIGQKLGQAFEDHGHEKMGEMIEKGWDKAGGFVEGAMQGAASAIGTGTGRKGMFEGAVQGAIQGAKQGASGTLTNPSSASPSSSGERGRRPSKLVRARRFGTM